MDDDLDGVVANIRACIISSKGAVPVSDLMRDYKTLVGSAIPYRKFNHSTLDSFLQSIDSLHVSSSGRETTVQAVTHTSSSHISSLISRQKTAKKKDFPPSKRGPPLRSQGYGRGRGRGYVPRSYPSRKELLYRREVPSSVAEPSKSLVIRVGENDRRQVTIGEHAQPSYSKIKYEVPPRLQKLHQNSEVSQGSPSLQSPPVISDKSKVVKEDSYMDNSSNIDSDLSDLTLRSQTIISPLGPSQLIAAGRAKQQAEIEKLEEYYLNDNLTDGSQVQAQIEKLEEYYLSDNLTDGSQDQVILGEDVPPEFNLNELQLGVFEENHLMPDLRLNLPDVPQPLAIQMNLPEVPQPPAIPVPDNQNYENNITLLQEYTKAKNWNPPDYQVITIKSKGTPTSYYGTVKISGVGQGVKIFKTFPFEDTNVYMVKGYAAKKALEEFLKEEEMKHAKKVISSNKKIMCDRISEIVTGVFNGMFSKKVEETYVTKYSEHLPDDWIQIVSGCPTVAVEHSLNNTIIIPKDYKRPQEFCFNRQTPAPTIVPEPIDLGTLASGLLDVYVTHGTSVSNVWFRLIGDNYSGKYEELLTNMDNYYITYGTKELVLHIERGQYYAAQSGDNWFRVCVSEVDEGEKTVTAWLIDHGDNDMFPFISLYRLPAEFCELPRQAIQCSLEGLESMNDDSIANEAQLISDHLIGKSLIAQISLDEQNSGFIKATLYDTSGSDDINVNEQIRDSIICIKGDPQLPLVGFATTVFVSCISKQGEIYIQLLGSMYENIFRILESLGDQEISKHKLTSYRQVVTNKIYLAKYKDDCWYRAVVTTTPSMQQNKVAVRFIDYGNSETVSITDIADVESLPPILSKLPPQAVKVALHNLPVESLSTAEVVKLNKMLLDGNKVILIKTISLKEDPPVVEIFCKNDDSGLESVIATIEMNRLQVNLTSPSFTTLNTSTNGHDSPTMCLRRPELDETYNPINIVLAANPGNFYFQPRKYNEDLKSLMVQLQDHYEATDLPVPKEEIVKGRVFAAQHTVDVTWYRAIVIEPVIGSKVPVRLCDYGDMICVPIGNLRVLESRFYKVPFMAVKGKLAGVFPIHMDWSVEDCIRFQNLVNNKILLAGVVNTEDNTANPMDIVFSLKLIDTNSEEDVVISDVLISENRAVKEK